MQSPYTTTRLLRQTSQKLKAVAALTGLTREQVLEQAVSILMDRVIFGEGSLELGASPLKPQHEGPVAQR